MADESGIFSISEFRKQLNSGARANLFQCSVFNPGGALADIAEGSESGSILGEGGAFTYLCRSAAIPAYTVGVIEVPFRGKRIKVPGDRTFTDWTATVVVDAGHAVRRLFEQWSNLIVGFDGEEDLRSNADIDYYANIEVKHLRADGSVSRVYKLYNAFPSDVSPIELSYDTTDTVEEFTVTFQYTHLTAGNTTEPGIDASARESDVAGF